MKQYELTLTVLEDLHVGTGLGLGEIDDTQIRDRFGHPVIPATHIKGLLRDALMAWWHATGEKFQIEALFGAPGGQRGALTLTSAYLSNEISQMVVWGSTRISEETGTALEDTLRFFEYVPAGTRFKLHAQLEDEALEPVFKQALSHCTHLGKGKGRGHGRVRWQLKEMPNTQPYKTTDALKDQSSSQLRLILRNLDPLVLPATAHPGNLIPSSGWINGAMLRGAILYMLIEQGELELADRLCEQDILWGPAYPLPETKTEFDWETLIVAPIPLSIGTPKQVAKQTEYPWWLERSTGIKVLGEQGEQDMLSPQQPAEKLKRPKPFELVCQPRKGQPWQRYHPHMLQRLRTRVPDNHQPQALFAQEEIAEKTLFCADIQFTSYQAAKAVETALDKLAGCWLRLGRGGRAVEINHTYWVASTAKEKTPPPQMPLSQLELWLHTDLIIRDRWLRFHSRLDKVALQDLLGHKVCNWQDIEVDTRSDQTRIHGFNAAAGLPRTPRIALKAGSVARIQGPPEQLAKLYECLLSKPAWGEGIEDGLGRITVNAMPVLSNQTTQYDDKDHHAPSSLSSSENASIYSETYHKAKSLGGLKEVSKTQIDQAREYVLASMTDAAVSDLFEKIKNASKKYAGADWQKVINKDQWKELEITVQNHPNKRQFMDSFFRWCRVWQEEK